MRHCKLKNILLYVTDIALRLQFISLHFFIFFFFSSLILKRKESWAEEWSETTDYARRSPSRQLFHIIVLFRQGRFKAIFHSQRFARQQQIRLMNEERVKWTTGPQGPNNGPIVDGTTPGGDLPKWCFLGLECIFIVVHKTGKSEIIMITDFIFHFTSILG